MKLRQGRRVPSHVYLQSGPEPSDDDRPLFTVDAAVARWLVAAVEHAEARTRRREGAPTTPRTTREWALAHDLIDSDEEAFAAFRAAREAIR